MKKNYETPVAEKLEFDYTENVVASGIAKNGDKQGCTVTTKKNGNSCAAGGTQTKKKKC